MHQYKSVWMLAKTASILYFFCVRTCVFPQFFLSHLQLEELELVEEVTDPVASPPDLPFCSHPPHLAAAVEEVEERGWDTGQFQHSQRTQAARNLRD